MKTIQKTILGALFMVLCAPQTSRSIDISPAELEIIKIGLCAGSIACTYGYYHYANKMHAMEALQAPLESSVKFENLKRDIPTLIKILQDCFNNPSKYILPASQQDIIVVKEKTIYERITSYFKSNNQPIITPQTIIPQGILLHGEPGTGKTELVRALAGEGIPVFYMPAAALADKYIGETEANLRNLYKNAENYAINNGMPFSIVVLDEIDTYGRPRENNSQSKHQNAVINQLLTLMDGAGIEKRRVVTIGITNVDPKELDEALTRPGRFTYHVKLENPTQEEKTEILMTALEKTGFKCSDACNKDLAELEIQDLSTATFPAIAHTANLLTRYHDKDVISSTIFQQALELHRIGS
ncbi:MAG: ATP-binding protein [Candidatus Babeliaceae bacterium]|jgi:SpoVK/Ycf46/Vps4 family AAA+-type ATPase